MDNEKKAYDKETTQIQANEAVLFERANNGNNLKPFDYFVAGCKFEASTTPAPLSEQKQEGETVSAEAVLSRYEPVEYESFGGYDRAYVADDCIHMMEAYASQNTAKQIEELTTNNFLLGEEISSLNNEHLYQKEQIDQYKARVAELEAKLFDVFWKSLKDSGYNNDELNQKPRELMNEAFEGYLSSVPESVYIPKA